MKTILVTGDPICDHNYYKGNRMTADSKITRGVRNHLAGGGALLLKELIAKTMEGERHDGLEWNTVFGLDEKFRSFPMKYHSYCLWEPMNDGTGTTEYWRAVEPPLGYGHLEDDSSDGSDSELRESAYLPPTTPFDQDPDIVVIDDAGIGFREESCRSLWPCVQGASNRNRPRWVVFKLTGPIGKSALWDEVVSQCKDNLIVIVPGEELRRRDVRLSKALSWEATAEDLAAELQNNPKLTPMLKARHLIVTFQSDGAFWLDNDPEKPESLLVFDSSRAECEWSESQGKGGAFGYLSCLTAAVVRELCLSTSRPENNRKPDLEAALAAGLSASRRLRLIGHGKVVAEGKEPPPGFPFVEIVKKIRKPGKEFESALIPQFGARTRGHWMMLDEWQVQAQKIENLRPHCEAALAVAVLGLNALERFPIAQFGKYQTVDRNEIESLRTIVSLSTTI